MFNSYIIHQQMGGKFLMKILFRKVIEQIISNIMYLQGILTEGVAHVYNKKLLDIASEIVTLC